MQQFYCVEDAIGYIESHLTSACTGKSIAQHVYYSRYHFHRVFADMARETVNNYLRKRRLTEAAIALIETDQRVLDIALMYQFESQASFTRSFKQMFGTTPARYRRNGKHLYHIYKDKIDLGALKLLHQGITMEPKIVTKDTFHVAGIRYYGANEHDEIGAMWKEFDQRRDQIKNADQSVAYGVCFPIANKAEENEFEYIAAVAVPDLNSIPDGMVGRTIEKQRYAVFTHEGSLDNLQTTFHWVMNTYFPKSEFKPLMQPDFEYYDYKFKGKHDPESKLDLYFPIA